MARWLLASDVLRVWCMPDVGEHKEGIRRENRGKIIPFIPFEPYAYVIRVLRIEIVEFLVFYTEP